MDNKNIERKALYLTVLSNFLFFLLCYKQNVARTIMSGLRVRKKGSGASATTIILNVNTHFRCVISRMSLFVEH